MALDIGTKRTGIAVSDPMNIIATALEAVLTTDLIDYLKKYTSNELVDVIVIGEPKQLDNSPSESAGFINDLTKKIQSAFPNIQIKRVDERFTSKMASRVIAQSGKTKKEKQKKEHIDTVSATILLQSYMESIQ